MLIVFHIYIIKIIINELYFYNNIISLNVLLTNEKEKLLGFYIIIIYFFFFLLFLSVLSTSTLSALIS